MVDGDVVRGSALIDFEAAGDDGAADRAFINGERTVCLDLGAADRAFVEGERSEHQDRSAADHAAADFDQTVVDNRCAADRAAEHRDPGADVDFACVPALADDGGGAAMEVDSA